LVVIHSAVKIRVASSQTARSFETVDNISPPRTPSSALLTSPKSFWKTLELYISFIALPAVKLRRVDSLRFEDAIRKPAVFVTLLLQSVRWWVCDALMQVTAQ
jgi:hypothetical protein